MYIEAVPNRNSPPAILLRESYRHEGKVRKRTLCNLSDWSAAHVEGLRGVLKGGTVIPAEHDAITVTRSLPHGHFAAALGTARKIGLDRILGPDGNRCRDLVLALLVGRILDPVSKLAAARALSPATASCSLGEALGLGEVDDDELYAALDWLLARQAAIETALAKRHLQNGTLVLYDVSSSYMEGRCCPLAKRGHSRDGKKGTLQIVYGLLCAPDGCPIAIEVFEGNTGDPATLAPQIDKLKRRFGLSHVVLVGDRGMITEARLAEDIKSAGLDWITALRGPAIKDLLKQRHFATHTVRHARHGLHHRAGLPWRAVGGLPQCRSRRRAQPQTRRSAGCHRKRPGRHQGPCRAQALSVAWHRRNRASSRCGAQHLQNEKHFDLTITDDALSFARKTAEIAAEAATDGLYVVRTNLLAETLGDADTVRSYKSLARVERAFRCIKTVDLNVRPVYHWLEGRVRAHVFLCMLAYYLEWHMRQCLAPMLFDDTDKEAAEALRSSVVAQARRSETAVKKQTTGMTPDGLPVHSFRTLLADLATMARNTIVTAINPLYPLTVVTRPTLVQQKAFDLLGLAL
jgi:hypothetical protein